MSIFSLTIILFWAANLVLNSYRAAFIYQLVFSIYICIFIGIGYFLNTSFIRIDYWQISSLLTFLTSIKILFSYRKLNFKLVFFILILLINLTYLLINPLNMNVVVGYGGHYEFVLGGMEYYKKPIFSKFTVFSAALAISQAIVAFVVFRILNYEERLRIILLLSIPVKITFIFIFFEYLIKYSGNGFIFDTFTGLIFGYEEGHTQTIENSERGQGFLLQGLNREGSHLVVAIFTSIIILYINSIIKLKKTNDLTFIGIGLVLTLLSLSFSAVLSLVILFLMYCSILFFNMSFRIRFGRLIPSILITVSIIILILIALLQNEYLMERLNSAFNEIDFIWSAYELYSQTLFVLSSTMARLVTIVESFNILTLRPIIGIGLGTHFAHGTTGLTLAEIGLLGFISYVLYYFYSWNALGNKFLYFLLVFYWILFNVFISIPSNTLVVRGDTVIVSLCFYLLINTLNRNESKL